MSEAMWDYLSWFLLALIYLSVGATVVWLVRKFGGSATYDDDYDSYFGRSGHGRPGSTPGTPWEESSWEKQRREQNQRGEWHQ